MSSQPQPSQQRSATATVLSQGSQTQTESGPSSSAPQPAAILRLRGAHGPSSRTVQWDESVVDNEGLGRKSSKGTFPPAPLSRLCKRLPRLIYHQYAASTTGPKLPASRATSRRRRRRTPTPTPAAVRPGPSHPDGKRTTATTGTTTPTAHTTTATADTGGGGEERRTGRRRRRSRGSRARTRTNACRSRSRRGMRAARGLSLVVVHRGGASGGWKTCGKRFLDSAGKRGAWTVRAGSRNRQHGERGPVGLVCWVVI